MSLSGGSALWGLVAAAVESGAGVPYEAMLHDGDLYATVTEYLDHRSRTLQKRMKRR